MMSRTFYFLRDSVTDKFYSGAQSDIVVFSNAAVYYQLQNAQKKRNTIISHWRWLKSVETWDEVQDGWWKQEKKRVTQREKLPNWGIEIIKIEINEKELE